MARMKGDAKVKKMGIRWPVLTRKLTYAEHRLSTESAIAAEGHEGSNPSTSSFILVSWFTKCHPVKQVTKEVK